MKRCKEEHGYAMLIVLLLIVLVTISTAVFMNASISTAKQEQIVDSNNMAVVAAEMGMDYYLTYLENEENRVFQDIKTWVMNKQVCNSESKPVGCTDLEEIEEYVVNQYHDEFDKLINVLDESSVHYVDSVNEQKEQGEIYFTLSSKRKKSKRTDPYVNLSLRVNGTSPTNTSNLEASITYMLPVMIINENNNHGPGNGSGGKSDESFDFNDFVPKNVEYSNPCSRNGKCKTTGGTFYTQGDIRNQNVNNYDGFTWFHKGELDAGNNNMNNMNATLVVESLSMKNNVKNLSGSLVLVGNKEQTATVNIGKGIELDKTGKVCINLDGYDQTTIANLIISGQGKVYYYTSKKNAHWPGKGTAIQYTDLSLFMKDCTGLSPDNPGNGDEDSYGNLVEVVLTRSNEFVEVEVDYITNEK